jgi:hypothetical protein
MKNKSGGEILKCSKSIERKTANFRKYKDCVKYNTCFGMVEK